MLDELAKCAAGTCSCPTPQYEKLSAIGVKAEAGGVIVDLKVKPGEQIDTTDIEQCHGTHCAASQPLAVLAQATVRGRSPGAPRR
ncbi:hypothetical protein FSC37_15900 [Piscinibacter aquaticus]|uniref:Uncharacterized protein n=1 Tax=Piscinibacter aquaticus TaxID=392597 RepID=A0A5C6U4N3_9BURK|nr:hypothetical protein FSC37_15900 [Piscinibacter aquaticus]